jgi:MFS family permease
VAFPTSRISVPPQWKRLLWPQHTGSATDFNIQLLYHDVLWSSLLSGIINTFLSVFLLRLGGTAFQVSLLVALPSIGGVFFSLRAARYVSQHRQTLTIVIIPSLLFRVGYPLLAFAPLLGSSVGTWFFVAVIALTGLPTVLSNIALTSQLGDVLPVDRRAHVLSVRNMLSGATATLAAFAGGWLLSLLPFPLNYQMVFVVSFVLSLIGLYHRNRLLLPPPPAEQQGKPPAPIVVGNVLRRPAFRHLSIALGVYLAGLYWPQALFSILQVKTLEASDAWIGIIGTGSGLAATLAYPLWGRLLGKGRLRQMMGVAAFGLALFPGLAGISPNVVVYLLVSIYGNLFGAGVSTAFTQVLIEMGPPGERPTRVAVYNTMAGAAAVVLPLLGALAYQYIGIQWALIVSSVLRLAGAALLTTTPPWKPDEE